MTTQQNEWKNNGSIYILQIQFFRLKKLIDEFINQVKHIEAEIEILQKKLDKQGKHIDFDDLNRYMNYMQKRSKSIIDIHEVYNLLDICICQVKTVPYFNRKLGQLKGSVK